MTTKLGPDQYEAESEDIFLVDPQTVPTTWVQVAAPRLSFSPVAHLENGSDARGDKPEEPAPVAAFRFRASGRCTLHPTNMGFVQHGAFQEEGRVSTGGRRHKLMLAGGRVLGWTSCFQLGK